MKKNTLLVVVLLLLTACLFSYPVGEIVSFDMEGANVAGVTSDGLQVAGYMYPWSGVVSWTEEGGLVTVDSAAEAGAISDDGRIFGSKIDAELGHELPCYWDADFTYHALPYLEIGQNSDMFFGNVWSCNTAGTRLGGMQWTTSGGTTPVIWYLDDEENWQILDLMPEDTTHSGRVNGVSEDGTKFGGWLEADDGAWIPHVWTVDDEMNVTYEIAPAPAGWVDGQVSSFSQNGEYMTGYMNSMGVLWNDDGTFDMYQPDNPSTWMNMSSVTVSNDGLCVGRTIDHQNWDQWAHVYKPGMGYMRADDYLNMFGVVYPADYNFLDMIYWVSADESLMMGWYYDINWGIKYFMLALPELSYIEGTVALNGTIGSVEEVLISVGSTGTLPDETGFYSLALGGGTYDLSASMAGYISQTVSDVVVPEGTTLTGYDFNLEQIPNAGFIEGNLTQVYNWDSFTMATITANDGTSMYSTNGTDAATYQLILPAGTYDITATQNNCFEVIFEDVVVVENEVTQLDVEYISINTPSYVQMNLVVDDPDNFNWDSVKIKIGNNDWSSNFSVWESSYSGEIWTPGIYTVSVWAEGYELWTEDDVEFVMNETTTISIPFTRNTYPVQDLMIADTTATASWNDPLPVTAYYQDNEIFQTDFDVTINIAYWNTPLWPSSNAFITEEMAYEGTKSVRIGTVDGIPGDIYRDTTWPGIDSSTHIHEAMLYIPSGNCGHQGIIRNGVWEASFAIELFYRADGTLDIMMGGNEMNLTYPQDQWFSFKFVSDLDNDVIEYYQDGSLLANGQYSLDAYTGEVSALTLGAYDISAEARPDFTETGLVYMDNYKNYTPTDITESTFSVSLDGVNVASGLDVNEYMFENLTADQMYNAGVTANYIWDSSFEVTEEFTYSPAVLDPPTNVVVDEYTAEMTWNAPGAGAETEFRYDDGIATAQLGFGDNPYSVMGGSHFHNAVINEVTWLLTSNAIHTEAVLYIFGLDAAGIPDTGQLLHESTPQPNVDDSWNTYTLPTPVDAPNGFFVGVCTPNIFTAIGTDDGVGDPYIFTEGNQMGIADWTAGNDWLDVGPAGFPFNFTVRALGIDLGELTFAPREPLTGNGTENITYSRLETPISDITTTCELTRELTRDLTGYEVFLDGASVASVTETNYTFTGLTYDQEYVAGVKAIYDNGSSDLVTYTFTYTEPFFADAPSNLSADEVTGDLTWTAPGAGGVAGLEEGFETWPPAGWIFTDADADGYQWDDGGALGLDGHTGLGLAYSASYDNTAGALNPDNWLISPAVTVGANANVNYWVAAQDNAWAGEHYGVYVSTTGTDVADFELVFEETMVGRAGAKAVEPRGSRVQGTWYERNVDLSAYTGTIYVAFRHFNVTDMFYLDLDDVTISSDAGRELTRDLTGYEVFLDGASVTTVTETNYTLTGLVAGTTYEAGVTAVYDDGSSEMITVSFTYNPVDGDNNNIVAVTALNGNYPNPFNPTTNISFSLKEAGNVTLEVYNSKGQKVKTLVRGEMEAANHMVTWNGDDNNGKKVSSGIYFYKMKTIGYTSVKKMLLIK